MRLFHHLIPEALLSQGVLIRFAASVKLGKHGLVTEVARITKTLVECFLIALGLINDVVAHCSVLVRCFPMCIRCAYTRKVASTRLTDHTTETTTGYIIVMQGLLRGDGSTSTPPILTQLQGDSHGILMGKLIIPVENLIPRGN